MIDDYQPGDRVVSVDTGMVGTVVDHDGLHRYFSTYGALVEWDKSLCDFDMIRPYSGERDDIAIHEIAWHAVGLLIRRWKWVVSHPLHRTPVAYRTRRKT